MNLFALLPSILKTVGNALNIGVVKDAAAALQGATLTAEQQASLQQALLTHEATMKQLSIDELKAVMSESLAMLSSSDKYVARARPTGLYIFYGVSAAIAIGMLFGVKIDPTAVLTILAPLAGVSGTYVYNRTREKLNGGGRE